MQFWSAWGEKTVLHVLDRNIKGNGASRRLFAAYTECPPRPLSHFYLLQYQTYFEIQDGAQEKEAAGVTSTFYRPERGERMLQRNTLPSPHIYHEAISTTPAERPNGDVTVSVDTRARFL